MGILNEAIFKQRVPAPIFGHGVDKSFIAGMQNMERIDYLLKRDFDFDVFLETKNVNLQRGFVWNESQKQSYIIALLNNSPCGHLAVFKDIVEETSSLGPEKVIWKVIDGKQRLGAIIDFTKNEFPISLESENFFFKDFEESFKRRLLSKRLPINYVESNQTVLKKLYQKHNERLVLDWIKKYEVSDEALIQWFLQINFKGVPQLEADYDRIVRLL